MQGPGGNMSMRFKLISCVTLAAIALATWRFMSRPAESSLGDASPVASGPASRRPPPVGRPKPFAAPDSIPPLPAGLDATRTNPAESRLAEPVADPNALNERTLVGTKWEREGFGIEFGADGKLMIGGRERAKWRVEGQRIRLYRDTTGEEHWLDIVGNKLMWEGQEIGRVP